jgi:hypothetical protein
MRVAVLAISTIAAGLAAAPAQAQTYNPRYPVCLQIYNIGGERFDCRFTSLEQCAASASGGVGQCINNPFYTGTGSPYRR